MKQDRKKWFPEIGKSGKFFRMMKLVLFLCCVGMMQVSAMTYAQTGTVSIRVKEASVLKVLQLIEAQSGYTFVYNNEQMNRLKPVSLNAIDEKITKILDECLADSPLGYELIDKVIVISQRGNAPQATLTIRGTVKDKTGNPLPGVSVFIKGTNTGVATDVEGNFKMDVPKMENIILVFSFIGMEKQEIKYTDQKTLKVVMKEAVAEIDEVVVNGYFNRKKDSFTGNAVAVTGDELKKVSNTNIFKALTVFDPSFRITDNIDVGSNPNARPEFKIRGASGIGNTEIGADGLLSRSNLRDNPNLPTFILDGYEVSVDKIFDMDMERIESLTILKDAAATAIYGSRAANGVVVIKTVEPKEGKLMVNYRFDAILTLPNLTGYDLLNAREKLEVEKKAGLYYSEYVDGQQNYDLEYNYKLRLINKGIDTYWLSQPLHTTMNHKHSLYVEGGDKSIRYGMDFRFFRENGVMKESGRNRGGIGFFLSYNLNDKLLIRNNVSIDKVSGKESPYGSFSIYAQQNPYYPIKDEEGNWIKKQFHYIAQSDQLENPLYEATLGNKDIDKYTEIADNFSIDWTMGKGFRLRANAAYRERRDSKEQFTSPESVKYNLSDYTAGEGFWKRGEGYTYRAENYSWDISATLLYNVAVGRHYINLALGGNMREEQSKDLSFSTRGYPSKVMNYLTFAREFLSDKPGGSQGKSRLAGMFVSGNYSFANRYLLDLSFRMDGSSQFGADEKMAPFFAGGIGWNIHNEKFMEGWRDKISLLKIRATYGSTGKASFPPYQAQTMFNYITSSWYITGIGAQLIPGNGFGNPDLQWEVTKKTDVGIELSIFDDRLSVIADYYIENTNNLLSDITLPTSTGFSSYKENVGKMQNRGMELSLRGVAVKNENWYVALFANMAHNKNKIVKISNALRAYNDKVDELQGKKEEDGTYKLLSRPLLRYREGKSINAIYAMRSLGIDPANGKELYENLDGTRTYEWDASQQTDCGDTEPKLSGAFGVNASYKGFNLNMSFLYRLGGQVYNQTLIDRVENANLWKNVDRRVLEQRWQKPGDVTFFKDVKDTSITPASSRFVQDENTLQFNSFSLSYDFSKDWLKKIGFQTLRLEAQMNDIFRLSTVKRERGLDYPFARTMQLGLYVQF